jgi:para-nitrobenzyl esterase
MGVLPELGDEEQLAAAMAGVFPDGTAAVAAYRDAESDGSPNDWLISFLTDQNYHMPDFRPADVRLRHDARVWTARFSWESPAEGGKFGACHGLELPFLFWQPGQTGGFLGAEKAPAQLAHAIQDAWVAFARSGDPNSAGLPEWPRYESSQRAVMDLATEPQVLRDPDRAQRIIWQDVVL